MKFTAKFTALCVASVLAVSVVSIAQAKPFDRKHNPFVGEQAEAEMETMKDKDAKALSDMEPAAGNKMPETKEINPRRFKSN